MRGHIRKRYEGSWEIIYDIYEVDPETGFRRRRQKSESVKGPKRNAEKRLSKILNEIDEKTFVEPSKITFSEWLMTWVEAIKPNLRNRTYEDYKSIIRCHLQPALGHIRLQDLDSVHLDRYYVKKAEGDKEKKIKPLSASSLEHHHVIISSSLKAAMKKRLVFRNVAQLVTYRPQAPDHGENVRENCWDAGQARTFLQTAINRGIQQGAFYTLALDTGMRKSELCGLRWPNIDLDSATVRVVESLEHPGPEPKFGPTKNGNPRAILVGADTVTLLRKHRAHQLELKLRNGARYHDHGLVFAKEWENVKKSGQHLGEPLQANNLGQREYADLIKAAKVKPITFHGLRHTCATLLLLANVPVKVVSERLGHSSTEITADIYQHVLPSMQEDAARKIGGLLFG